MENLAKKIEQPQPCLENGQVIAGKDGRFIVQTAYGPIQASLAVSCLVQPRAGDRTLLSTDGEGDCFILSVLKRGESKEVHTELVFDGQVDLHVRDGGLSLTTDRDISLASREKLAFASKKISAHADKGEAVIERMSFVGKALHSQVKRVMTVANTVEHIFRRFTQRLEDSFRFVKDHEEVQTGNTRYLVEDTLTLHAKNANHMAEELVTINAEQIHLG